MILDFSEWPNYRERLESLFFESFGRRIDPSYFDWRYIKNKKNQLLFAIEIEGDKIVASYSAFPVDLEFNGCVFRAALSMTTMTHPKWRGRGLFQKLASELYMDASKSGVAVIWGFPNANSHATFTNKLEWSDIYEIPTMVLHLSPLDGQAYAIESAVKRDDDFSGNYLSEPYDGLIRVKKTREYLSWRYAKNPLNTYSNYVISSGKMVSSYVVTKSYGGGIDLVDMCFRDVHEAKTLLRHIIKESISTISSSINCWMPTHHWAHSVLEEMGFANSAPVTYLSGRQLIFEIAPSQWKDYRGWYLQMGDSDVY